MPAYTYRCKNPECNHEFSTTHSMKQSLSEALPDYSCPRCGTGAEGQERLIDVCSFILKGGGWAKDGYQKEKAGNSLPKI